jgi:hypothetical protein
MPGKFLIDLTDARFQTPQNADVIEFIRVKNPFAHSDVGSIVFDLAKSIPGAHAYSPAVRSFAYVVLHDDADRIFAIAYDQRGFGLRLAPSSVDAAVADGAEPAPDLGPDWVTLTPWDAKDKGRREKINAWTQRALSESQLR